MSYDKETILIGSGKSVLLTAAMYSAMATEQDRDRGIGEGIGINASRVKPHVAMANIQPVEIHGAGHPIFKQNKPNKGLQLGSYKFKSR